MVLLLFKGLFVATVEVARSVDETIFAERIATLKTMMKEVGIEYAACIPGKSPALLCPKVPSLPL